MQDPVNYVQKCTEDRFDPRFSQQLENDFQLNEEEHLTMNSKLYKKNIIELINEGSANDLEFVSIKNSSELIQDPSE
jgi:hypothetical protein